MKPMLATFRREHVEMLSELYALDQALAQCAEGWVKRERVRQVVQQLQALIRERLLPHCVREKRALRPLLRRGSHGSWLTALLEDDRLLRREERLLQHLLHALEQENEPALGQVIAAGERIIAALIEHIHQEEIRLFPILESLGAGEGKGLHA
mgnify:CR=1 FL=1